MGPCRVCSQSGLSGWLDFGPQAIRNRFVHSMDEYQYAHPLRIGVCRECGVVQLADPPPVAEIRPRFDWIQYNEPERHLDSVAAEIAQLPGITPDSAIVGLTYKDDSTLARLQRLGFARTRRVEWREDLGIEAANSGIESVQERLTAQLAGRLAERIHRPDLLIVRHVLEHTHDTPGALDWAARFVRPGGYVVFEVPDTCRAIERSDYTTVWEEHVLYFTARTLRGTLERAGYEIVSLTTYPYSLENSLVAIARPVGRPQINGADPTEIAHAEDFLRSFPRVRERMHRQLGTHGRIAMLGAGHLTGAFVNLYGLAGRIEFVADDNPRKQGLFMPGSRLPILPPSALVDRGVDLCLMTVRPEIEDAVAAKNASFTQRGGVLASIFPDSPYALEHIRGSVGVVA